MNQQKNKGALWQKHLENWEVSGLSQVAWCKQNNLSLKQFSYWKKKLLPTFSQRFIAAKKTKPSDFIPVTTISEPIPADDLSLALPNGSTITGITAGNLEMAVMLAGQLL